MSRKRPAKARPAAVPSAPEKAPEAPAEESAPELAQPEDTEPVVVRSRRLGPSLAGTILHADTYSNGAVGLRAEPRPWRYFLDSARATP